MDLVALKTLRHCQAKPKFVSIESEKVLWDKLIEEFKVLEELGYDSFKLVEQSGVPRQKIPEKSVEGLMIEHQFKGGSTGLFGTDLIGQWLSRKEAIEKYKKSFILYRLFGDRSIFIKVYLLRVFKAVLQRAFGMPLPGWYHTHARLKD